MWVRMRRSMNTAESIRKVSFCVSSLVALISALTAAPIARANVVLPDVISDAMVLQRDRAVPIWGKADPGESVTVKFGTQAKTAVAGADGKWIIRLRPMRSSATPQTMVVEGRNRIELKDILVGEVWLVSGQSNMQRLLSETANGE